MPRSWASSPGSIAATARRAISPSCRGSGPIWSAISAIPRSPRSGHGMIARFRKTSGQWRSGEQGYVRHDHGRRPGLRMRPLTDDRPKPLVTAGVNRIVVNLHYRGEMLRAHLARRRDCEILFSDESDKLLDTGGGVVK